MRIETFNAIMREISRDPLTEKQKSLVAELDRERIINTAEAAELLGLSTITLRRIKSIPRVRTNGRHIHYRQSDIIAYRDKMTY